MSVGDLLIEWRERHYSENGRWYALARQLQEDTCEHEVVQIGRLGACRKCFIIRSIV